MKKISYIKFIANSTSQVTTPILASTSIPIYDL